MALRSTLVDNSEVGHRPQPLLASVTHSPPSHLSDGYFPGNSWPSSAGHLLWGIFPTAEEPRYVLTFPWVRRSTPISMGYLHSDMHHITILHSTTHYGFGRCPV
ncbi:uncharacterized protein LACBIDRAFT_303209 [Laccaria bicolor S238N-H82]|uniref:Predicted protein n=1 Tax=Laccaria bicolor (strain S238N-H82 / ATCC MYA-4686) TaxID=486041 RepID=B0DJ45_LACBS|nr:uncharacterized protein LACBIDRAFT_303209 [Laccaria bicolor S238N-H82]EDR05458.1 predicted protein [Laccaria bicolor S238N-H82]|eukprot:XP_001884016.1 predicted protein [Laccaria bicolor S238N-H82]